MLKHCILALAGLVALTVPGIAAAADRYSVGDSGQLDVVIDNSCSGEPVALTIDWTFSFSEVVDSAGTHHTLSKYSLIGSGISLVSGVRYQYRALTVEGGNWGYEPGGEFTWIGSGRLVGQGPDDNLVARYRVHATDTPDGDVAVAFEVYTTECSG